MTARSLYDKYCDSLRATKRERWDGSAHVRSYPVHVPPSWPFLPDREKNTWKDLARRLTPKRRKP